MCGRAEGVDSEAAWCFTRGPANSFCWEGAEVGGHTAGRVNDEREKKTQMDSPGVRRTGKTESNKSLSLLRAVTSPTKAPSTLSSLIQTPPGPASLLSSFHWKSRKV